MARAQPPCSFSDQSAAAGLDSPYSCPLGVTDLCDSVLYWMTSGGAAGDFDNDGWVDLFILGGGAEPDHLYMNNGPDASGVVTFTDRATEAGVALAHFGTGVAVGDVNNDGRLDIYVTSFGPPEVAPAFGYHRLYINTGTQGSVAFVDIAEQAGVAITGRGRPDGFGAALGDYDLDGDLDLAVGGWIDALEGNRLFRNDGADASGAVHFTDVTGDAIVFGPDPIRGFSPRFADMDGDRYPELLWVADFETSRYFINNADGTFTDATAASGTSREDNGMGQTLADFDGDTRPDWFVTSIYGAGPTGNTLYLNQGGHRYVQVAHEAGVDVGGWGWGTAALDANLDGLMDIAETNGWPAGWRDEQMYLYLNRGDGTFAEAALPSGLDHTGMGRGLFTLDYDNDGDQDLVVLDNQGPPTLYRNDTAAGHWLRIALDTSRDRRLAPRGQGARIIAEVGPDRLARFVTGGTNYLSQGQMLVHLGLGTAPSVDVLRVQWSRGVETILRDVPADQMITISACPADLTGDARADVRDFFAFVRALADMDPIADLDGDGVIGGPDVLVFFEAFGACN